MVIDLIGLPKKESCPKISATFQCAFNSAENSWKNWVTSKREQQQNLPK